MKEEYAMCDFLVPKEVRLCRLWHYCWSNFTL